MKHAKFYSAQKAWGRCLTAQPDCPARGAQSLASWCNLLCHCCTCLLLKPLWQAAAVSAACCNETSKYEPFGSQHHPVFISYIRYFRKRSSWVPVMAQLPPGRWDGLTQSDLPRGTQWHLPDSAHSPTHLVASIKSSCIRWNVLHLSGRLSRCLKVHRVPANSLQVLNTDL